MYLARMRIVYSANHHFHSPPFEFTQGQLIPANECPVRADIILEHLQQAEFDDIQEPRSFSLNKILAIHDAGMVDLLANGYKAWEAQGKTGSVFPSSWPSPGSLRMKIPQSIDARLGYYCADTASPLTKTSWHAIKSSVDCALTAADLILHGDSNAFSLCRPPGHHAGVNYFGGFCFLNNSAIAAQHLLDCGKKKVAILDLDYHHGNGTQDIFYRRSDVLTVSIHADPEREYPFYWGHAEEIGEGQGVGFNLNLPLPLGSGWSTWSAALEKALDRIQLFSPDVLIVGLGVDTYKEDPISLFHLDTEHYPQMAEKIAALGLPSLIMMEGGYAVEALGQNVVGFLQGYEQVAAESLVSYHNQIRISPKNRDVAEVSFEKK